MNQDRNLIRVYARYAQLAFVLPTTTFVGWALGSWLDGRLGTHFLYLVFLLLGVGGGIVHLVRELNKDERGS